jgi:hypothetical protein
MKRAGERSVFAVFRNSFVTTTLAFVVVGTFVAAPALAKPPVGNPKPFYATVTPSPVGGGTSAPFQFSIVNESTQQGIGSAEVTVPAGFTNVSLSNPPAGSSVDSTNPNLVHLRNLPIQAVGCSPAPGCSTAIITITATTSCGAGSYVWRPILVKQSNNFLGTGNDGTYDPNKSYPTTQVSSAGCKLVFTNQPASAALDETPPTITSTPYDNTGSAVTVEVQYANGTKVSGSTVPITLQIAPQCAYPSVTDCSPAPAAGAAVSNAVVNAVDGDATFPDLSIDMAGDYRLKATSPNITSAYSDIFSISNKHSDCTPDSCTAADSLPGTLGATLTSSSTSGVVVVSVGSFGTLPSCDPSGNVYKQHKWSALPTTTVLDDYALSGGGTYKTVVLDIDKSAVHPNTSPQSFKVCFSTTHGTFKDIFGTTVQPLYNANGDTPQAGILPNCNSNKPELVTNLPCEFSAMGNGVGDVILTVLLSGADRVGFH